MRHSVWGPIWSGDLVASNRGAAGKVTDRNQPASTIYALASSIVFLSTVTGSREYQIGTSLIKLNRGCWTTAAFSSCISEPKKMVAPKAEPPHPKSQPNLEIHQPASDPRLTPPAPPQIRHMQQLRRFPFCHLSTPVVTGRGLDVGMAGELLGCRDIGAGIQQI